MESEIMTLREVAEYLKLSEKTVSRMAQEGRIPAQKLARQWRFQRNLVNSWLADPNSVPVDQQQLPPESTGIRQPLTVASVINPGTSTSISPRPTKTACCASCARS